jgi:hypothetical protein
VPQHLEQVFIFCMRSEIISRLEPGSTPLSVAIRTVKLKLVIFSVLNIKFDLFNLRHFYGTVYKVDALAVYSGQELQSLNVTCKWYV